MAGAWAVLSPLAPPVPGDRPAGARRDRDHHRARRARPASWARGPAPGRRPSPRPSPWHPGSTLRLQQLLAELGYLPLTFTPAAPVTSPVARGQRSGRHVLLALAGPACVAHVAVDTRDAQRDHHGRRHELREPERLEDRRARRALRCGPICSPTCRAARATPTLGTTCCVSKALPETATVFQNGVEVYSTPANTGVAAAPTAHGHVPGLRPLHGDDHERNEPGRLASTSTPGSRG